MEPSFNPLGDSYDPTGSEWMEESNLTSNSTQQASIETSHSSSLPPLIAPPPPMEEKDEDFIRILEMRLEQVKKQNRTVHVPKDGEVVYHVELGEKEVYKTKIEAEVEPLIDESEVAPSDDSENFDPVSHPRYASLASVTISKEDDMDSSIEEEGKEEGKVYSEID